MPGEIFFTMLIRPTIVVRLLTAVALAACCGRAQAEDSTPAEHLAIARMGTIVRMAEARHAIGFRPFDVPREIVAVALIPPFHGDDSRASRGVAIEYADIAGRRYVLAQWPRNGGNLEAFAPLEPADEACGDAATFPRGTPPSGIVWSTPHGLIMTLQPDGASDARIVRQEWKKLIRRGACR
jgi:hypothetical protein